MNQIKRRLSNEELVDEATKIFRTSIDEERKSITCIEDLSNELLYEIFEYFDGFHLYTAFSNLNARFEELLVSIPLPLKFRVPFDAPSNFQKLYNNVIVPNKHRIISFSTLGTRNTNAVFSTLTFDSSFNQLESLVLWERRSPNIISIIHSLTTLPRLCSLKIYINSNIINDYDPYVVIFSLPVLTYAKISIKTGQPSFYFWTNSDYQSSPLHCLIMDHPSASIQLNILLSYTPQLRHLHCRFLARSDEIIVEDMNIMLPNLTHFSIGQCDALFDDFEIFMKQIGSQLQVLCVATSKNAEYLNAERWEQLFVQYMPHLRIFEFKYEISFGASEFGTDDVRIVEFISTFWMERQWVCEFSIQIDDWEDKFITFSIQPYKERWYSINGFNPLHLSPSVVLNRAGFQIEWNQFSIDSIISVFITMRIAHLIIDCPNIHRKSLIKLLHSLHNLYSLKLYSVSLSEPECLPNEEEEDFRLVSTIDTITKVNLGRINELRDVGFLIDLCPNMDYFEADYSDKIDMKLLVRSILRKTTQSTSQLRTVCLHGQKPGEGITQELEDMIHHEQLLQNYTITCIDKKICIQLE